MVSQQAKIDLSPTLHAADKIDGLVYSQATGSPLLADLYLPRGATPPLPTVLWLHGGGWRIGDRKLGPDLGRFFAQSGFAMASIDYRLSGQAIFPAQVEDVKCAIRWLRSVADRYGLRRDWIALWGSSAGGHLAALAAAAGPGVFETSEHSGFSGEPQAVVDGYGPTDFLQVDAHRDPEGKPSDDPESVQLPRGKLSADADSFESLLIGAPIATRPDLVRRADPTTYVKPGLPPFLIMHGLSDTAIPAHQSELLYDALARTGNDATLVLIEGLGHGFFNRNHFRADADRVRLKATRDQTLAMLRGADAGFGMIETFLRRHLAD